MTSWLVFLVLEALGLLLLWYGARSDAEVQFALGIVLVFSVTALVLFRLLVRFLARRRSGKTVSKRKGAMLDVPGALALSAADSVRVGGADRKGEAAFDGTSGAEIDIGDG
ncbi:hypothetical protein [Pelagibius marinus]|uniref:hypothetical protein n=1 Tax=Pelagibius marinus TaxID=2762760 RepID=UPI001872AA9F|nr:hypothetical protein [Pelagibius marinus]